MRQMIHRFLTALPAALLALSLAFGAPSPVRAEEGHEGHNHGDEGPATPIPVNPRGVAETPSFQIATVLVRDQILVFLDHPDTNAPIANASIELTAGDKSYAVKPRGEGAYVVEGWKPKAGHNTLMFMVDADGTVDLLSVSIDVPEAAATAAAGTPAPAAGGRSTLVSMLIAVPVALLLGYLVSLGVSRMSRRRQIAEPVQT